MTFFKHRGLLTAGLALFLAVAPVSTAAAQPVSFGDPDDVNLPLDLKTLTHDHNESTITYTAETYDPFDDSKIDIKWAIDRNHDGKVDLFAAADYEDRKLEAKVEDANDKELGKATVRRINDRVIQLSFARKLVGTSYQYWVMAATDSNGNEEDDPGEFDLAPDAGFHPHQL
jgi:major membrane immunogen (membrane-anchored lipoprotein)